MKDAYAARFFLLTFLLSWGAWALLVRLVPAGLAKLVRHAKVFIKPLGSWPRKTML